MPDVLIRGLSEAAVARIDDEAASLGLSRNEFLRRKFESARSSTAGPLTVEDLRRAADAAQDLDDSQVMASAWQ
jgi:hypothetical protein